MEWVPLFYLLTEAVISAARAIHTATEQARAAAEAPVVEIPRELPHRGDLGAGVFLESVRQKVPGGRPRLITLAGWEAEGSRERDLPWDDTGDESVLLGVDVKAPLCTVSQN